MKILGLEIKRAETAAAPQPVGPTGAQRQLQQTKPTLPLKSASPRQTLGDSGTRMLHGIITEEYNSQLQGIQGIKVYDEMRKSDGTVRAAMLVCTLPIRRAEWFVNPSDANDQQSKDIANFVEHALFDWLDLDWNDVIRQALLMVPFGVMCFEKVYGIHEHEGKQYVTLVKLAPRLPKSILMWELTDGTFGIQQIRQDGVLAQIPGSKLLTFVNEREGDNWWGTSMLRAAYPHWYYKKNFYTIDAIAFERQGLGIPVITMPPGYTESDEKQAIKVLQNLRASESAYMVLPPEYKAEFLNMGASTTRDPEKSINHHNKEILQSVLAQFLELGVTHSNTGSHALASDHSDLFLKAMESIANTIISEVNKNLIPELVDLNFNDVQTYPVLDYSGITKVDVASLGTAYSQLVTAGALTPTDDDQQYLRAAMGLPPRTQEDIDAQEDEDPNMERQEDHVDIEDTDTTPDGDGVDSAADDAANTQENKQPKNGKKSTAPKKKAVAHEHKRPALFDTGEGFMSWRPLTFAETNVDWSKIQDTMNTMEAQFSKDAIEQLTKAKDSFMAKIHEALKSGDQNAIADLELQFQGTYADLLKSAMKKAYTYGKNTAASELGIVPPANTQDSITGINALADTIAKKTATDIETLAKTGALAAVKQDTSVLQAVGSVDSNLEDAIAKTVANTANMLVGQNINGGRRDVFVRNAGMIYALQRSELLDSKTCNFCISMDGRVVAPDDAWTNTDIFHTNCRGIWVAIMNSEQNPPPIDGVPDNVGSYYGGQTNELVQPKTPMPKAGGLAEAFVKEQDMKK